MRLFPSDQTAVWHWVNSHGLLEQTIEEFPSVARQSPIEAEGEFVQVIVEVCLGNPPLVDARNHRFSRAATRWTLGKRVEAVFPLVRTTRGR